MAQGRGTYKQAGTFSQHSSVQGCRLQEIKDKAFSDYWHGPGVNRWEPGLRWWLWDWKGKERKISEF